MPALHNILVSVRRCLRFRVIFGIAILLASDAQTSAQPSSSGRSLNYFIAPDGSDANDGTREKPFATLEQARDVIRQIKNRQGGLPTAGVTVFLRGGIYERRAAFSLGEEDSGTGAAPVIYRAHPGEAVSLIGGAQVPMAEFTQVTEERTLARLPESARGMVWRINLRQRGITNYGTLSLYGGSVLPPYTVGPVSAELFINGKPMTLARWPDHDYALVESVIETGSILRNWMPDMEGRDDRRAKYVPPSQRENPPRGFAFTMADSRLSRWVTATDAWLFGYWYWDWSDQSARVASIDPRNRILRTEHASGYGVRAGQRFFAYNLLEELDAPGEWYLDRQDGVLYLYPAEEQRRGVAFLSLCTEPLIRFTNASHITVSGLSLGTTRGDGVNISGGKDVSIEACDIGSLGGKAVLISDGENHTVRNCRIHDTGADGIHVTGGDRKSLTPGDHAVLNNEITRFSRLQKTYTPGVTVAGVGNRIAHNLIHDAPHAAVHFVGNDHVIEFNEIHHVLLESDDAGAVYSGRRFTFWGNKIRHNYFHDIYGLPPEKVRFRKGVLTHAVYLDDKLSGIEVTGNVFVRCNDAVAIKGSDNRFDNNLVIDCRRAVWDMSKEPVEIHAEALRYDQPEHLPKHLDYTVLNDILSVPYTSPLWRERYPELATSLERTRGPARVSVCNNVLWRTPSITVGESMRTHGRIANNHDLDGDAAPPADPTKLGAWIRKLPESTPGFTAIPFDQIGPRSRPGPQAIR